MDDLISRQAAIDAATDELDMIDHVPQWVFDRLEGRLKQLPPAQLGTNLAEVGTDCISRQAAINGMFEHFGANSIEDVPLQQYWNPVHVIRVLKELSPIQQKRGKWIEDKGQQTLMQNFIEKGEVWRVCSVCGAGHMIGHKYECDKAYHETHHNFCPNCGADMREVNHESN